MIGECHAHIFMNGNDYQAAVAAHQEGISEEVIAKHFREYVAAKVQYVRDGGDDLGVSLRAIGLAKQFGITYRTPIFAIHKQNHYGSIVGRAYETIEEYRQLVKMVRKLGGHFIKIMLSGIVDFNKFGVITGSDIDYEEVRQLIDIAHAEGFAVMAHVNGAKAVANAAKCGVDSIEHGYFIDDEAMNAMAENAVVWVPTLVTVANLRGTKRFPEAIIAKILANHQANISKAAKKGVLIAPGSDAGAYGVRHGSGIMEEYQMLTATLLEMDNAADYLQKGLETIRRKF